MYRKFLIISLFLTLSIGPITQLHAQKVPLLEREISLSVENQPIPMVLHAISALAMVEFSYSPSLIATSEPISLEAEQKTVRYILNTIFQGTVKYKERGKYIILQHNPITETQETIIEGYLYDAQTGGKIVEASIYDKEQRISAITNKHGHFQLKVSPNTHPTVLVISKQGYTDTLLVDFKKDKPFTQVDIKLPKQISEDLLGTSELQGFIKETILPIKLIPKPMRINSQNITDTLHTKFQITFVPPLGSNGILSGNTSVDYSFNIILGYVHSVNNFEIGGIANIVRKDMNGAQLAGMANLVGGNTSNFQAAGIANYSKSNSGIQLAGIANLVLEDVSSVQASGITNVTLGKVEGLQTAGNLNIARQLDGVQISGIANLSGHSDGTQVAGILNHANTIKGSQVAGIANNTSKLDGVQVASIINRASYFKGVQVALFNYADSCSGVPIGLFSFVRKGYHKIEFSTNEVFLTNLAFRTGVKRFHNIISVGVQPQDLNDPFWYAGYGIGTTLGKGGKYAFDIDWENVYIMKGNHFPENSTLSKLTVGIDRKLTKGISFAFGISYNIYTAQQGNDYYDSYYSKIPPYRITNTTTKNGNNIASWIGVKAGIRFL